MVNVNNHLSPSTEHQIFQTTSPCLRSTQTDLVLHDTGDVGSRLNKAQPAQAFLAKQAPSIWVCLFHQHPPLEPLKHLTVLTAPSPMLCYTSIPSTFVATFCVPYQQLHVYHTLSWAVSVTNHPLAMPY
jgi:hypothetical protein